MNHNTCPSNWLQWLPSTGNSVGTLCTCAWSGAKFKPRRAGAFVPLRWEHLTICFLHHHCFLFIIGFWFSKTHGAAIWGKWGYMPGDYDHETIDKWWEKSTPWPQDNRATLEKTMLTQKISVSLSIHIFSRSSVADWFLWTVFNRNRLILMIHIFWNIMSF